MSSDRRPEEGADDLVTHHTDGTVTDAPPVTREHAATPASQQIAADDIGRPDRLHEHPHPQMPAVRTMLPPTLTVVLGIAAMVVAVLGLREIGSIVAPTFLAVTLIIAVHPIYKLLDRFLPKFIAGFLLLVMLYGVLAAIGTALGVAVGKLAYELPKYSATFNGLIEQGQTFLLAKGISQEQIDRATSNFSIDDLTAVAQYIAGVLGGTTSSMLFLLTVMVFLAMDAGGFGKRLRAVHRVKPDLADALVDYGARVRKYWVVTTIFGLIVAAIDYVALIWLGVPLALTFGVLSFVTNYIPNIGFILGLIPPALLALLHNGVETMIWVIVIYCVANFVIQTLLQPKFTGDAVGLNVTTVFLSLVFWSYVFGALGALLAVPLTLLVKTLLIDRDPSTRWINQFIASHPIDDRSAQPL
ncbi:AI-2E family transporter [Janibacter sp. GXQ6167]|uniref:AI-2E family transporter n=1 Tax=Janibacter sp. GXQ6167 TaxID=3240791 RepID=UPI0035264665